MDVNGDKLVQNIRNAQHHLVHGEYTILCDNEQTTQDIIQIVKAIESGYQLIKLEQFIDAINKLATAKVRCDGDNDEYLQALEDVVDELRKAI